MCCILTFPRKTIWYGLICVNKYILNVIHLIFFFLHFRYAVTTCAPEERDTFMDMRRRRAAQLVSCGRCEWFDDIYVAHFDSCGASAQLMSCRREGGGAFNTHAEQGVCVIFIRSVMASLDWCAADMIFTTLVCVCVWHGFHSVVSSAPFLAQNVQWRLVKCWIGRSGKKTEKWAHADPIQLALFRHFTTSSRLSHSMCFAVAFCLF